MIKNKVATLDCLVIGSLMLSIFSLTLSSYNLYALANTSIDLVSIQKDIQLEKKHAA